MLGGVADVPARCLANRIGRTVRCRREAVTAAVRQDRACAERHRMGGMLELHRYVRDADPAGRDTFPLGQRENDAEADEEGCAREYGHACMLAGSTTADNGMTWD